VTTFVVTSRRTRAGGREQQDFGGHQQARRGGVSYFDVEPARMRAQPKNGVAMQIDRGPSQEQM
jgi:hypothetical protein